MRSIKLFFMMLILAGCSTNYPKVLVYPPAPAPIGIPQYPELGGFKLNEGTPTIDALLESFRNNGPKAFMARGLKPAYFEIYRGEAWCDISFKSNLVKYMFGVQLIQTSGGGVTAVVRNMSMDKGYPVDYRVMEVTPDVYAALLEAQLFKPALASEQDLKP